MKIRNYNIIVLLSISIFLAACVDVLDKRDLNSVDDMIWDNPVQATLYVNTLYAANMPGMSLGENSAMTDEMFSSSESYINFMYGLVTENDIDALKVMHREKYQAIRRINFCINGLENSALDDSIKGTILGQALFFRAYRYWEMVQLYGGIPMIFEPLDPFTDELDIPRSTTAESFQLIIQDLDQAISALPVDWPLAEDNGRITSGAAAAFKGRILLSWASPLFNRDNKQERWQQAYDASKQADELLSQMNTPRALHSDFSTIFTSSVLSNTEAIIFKRYDPTISTEFSTGWESSVRPRSGGGNFGYQPTWELVKAFPMANGKLISETGSGYDSTYFWQNRDPRFYATIAYNGCEWPMTGRTNNIQWSYDRNRYEGNTKSGTSFFNRKATDSNIPVESIGQTGTSWIELRYAEVLLNIAECANELGKKDEALENIRAIRARAGIEAGDGSYGISNSVSKEKLRELIMIERQVEFAFENKRYFDLRRRLMYRNDLGELVKKFNGNKRHGFNYKAKTPWNQRINEPGAEYHGYSRLDTAVYFGYVDINDAENLNSYFEIELKEMEAIVGGQVQAINYRELYDFFAIPGNFLTRGEAIEQTKGWVYGTFDPLAE